MACKSEVFFLLGEMGKWHTEGLLGEVTYRLLHSRYVTSRAAEARPDPLPPLPTGFAPSPLDPSPPAGAAAAEPLDRAALDARLDRELNQQADELVAWDVPAEPDLEESLQAEARYHLDLEHRARSASRCEATALREAVSRPAARREANVVSAACSALADVAGVALVDEQPAPPVGYAAAPRPSTAALQQEVLQRDSLWSSRVQPFLHENALWLASGLLVICGSLYFLSLIWDQLSSLLLHAVIAGSLLSYGAAFFGVGYVLSKRRKAHAVGRILFCFSAGILPLASVATGELAAVLTREAPLAGGVAALAVVAAVLAAQWFMMAVMGGLFERSCARPLTWSAVGLSALTMGVAPLAVNLGAGEALLLATALGFVVLRQGLSSLCGGKVNLRMSLLFVGAYLLWAMAVLVGRVHVAAPLSLPLYAPLVAAMAALLISCDHRLRLAAGHEPRLSPLGFGMYAALLSSMAMAVIGLAQLGYFNLWARISVLVTSAVVVLSLWQAAARYGRSAMTYLAAGTGLFTYFFLPAPFSGLVMLANRFIKSALGYQHQPLPVAYYGLAFIPYLVGLTVAAVLLARRGRHDLAADLQRFVLVLSALLVLAATSVGIDLRPSLWTWPIYAAGAFAWASLFGRPWLRDAGQAVTLAFLGLLGLWMHRQGMTLDPSLVLAAYGLAAGGASMLRPAGHLSRASLAAAILSLPAMIVSESGPAEAAVVLGLVTITMAVASYRHLRLGSPRVARITAHLAGLAAFAGTAISAVRWAPGADTAQLLFLAHAAVCALLVHLQLRAPDASPGRRLVAQPATVSALLALGVTLLMTMDQRGSLLPIGLALLALLTHLALASRGRVVMVLCALAAAVEVATLANTLVDPWAWPLALTLLACGYLLGAARLRDLSWPRAAGRALMLTICAYAVQTVALAAALSQAEQVHGEAWLWWAAAACAEGTLFFLCAAAVHRRPVVGVPALVVLAAASAACLAFLLEYVVPSGHAGAWRLGALAAGLGLAWSGLSTRLTRPHLRRAARWIGGLLPLWSLFCAAGFVMLCALQCGHAAGFLPRVEALAPGGAALACVGLLLLAAWAFGHLHGGRYAEELLRAAAVTAGLVLLGMALPQVHLSLALGLAAVALAWLRWRDVGPRAHLVWPLGLCVAALLASHGHLGQPHLLAALASLTAVLALTWRAGRAGVAELGWSLGLLASSQVLVTWLARELSTGRHPAASVLAPMAAAALATGLLLDWLQRRAPSDAPLRWAAAVSRLAPVLAALAAAAATTGSQPNLLPDVLVVALVTVAGAVLQLGRVGLRDRKPWMLHAAWLGATQLYIMLRTQTGLSEAGPLLDAVVILLASQLALWTATARRVAASPARAPLLAAATIWPLLAVVPCAMLSVPGAALLCLLVALHHAAASRVLGSRGRTVLAMGFANAALALSYSAAGWSDMMLYLLPLALTLLTLIHLYSPELGSRGCNALRVVVLVALYSLATGRALVLLSPFQAVVVVPAICVAGMVAGTLLRVRIYVWMGVAFLAVDLLLNMLRHGLAQPHLGALFLTLTGLLIVAGMVIFTLERERILARYSAVFNELRTWE